MKKLILLVMVTMTLLVMSGCGGGSVEVVIPVGPEPPSIALNQLTQDRVNEFIDGRISFFAPDSDIDTMTIAVFDESRGGILVTRVTTLIDLPGAVQGIIPFSIDYINYPNGTFTFSIFLTDFNGNTSNQIVRTFFIP